MSAILYFVYMAITIYAWMIVIRALMSWFPLRYGSFASRIYNVLYELTEPYLALFRRLLPTARVGGVGIDFSSLLALVVLFVLLSVVARL